MEETFHLVIPAQHRYLKLASGLITDVLTRDNRVDSTTIYHIDLALQELAANIIDHAYVENVEGRITIDITLVHETNGLVIDLHDTGRAFNPAQISAPNLEEAQVRGYGLHLAQKLMDDILYEARDDGNHWRMVKYL
jgi:anti-sigma regulatory factor (Ser/Thr protein kinase)